MAFIKRSEYRKYIIILLSFVVITYVSIVLLVNIIIDPYNESGLYRNSFNQYKFKQSRYTSINLFNKLKDNSYTLVFGTSRSARVGKNIINRDTLNFYSLYGNPKSIMNFLNKLSEQQIKNIDKIYFLLDHHTFDGDKYVNLIDFNSRSEFILGLVKNLNYQKIKDSIDTIYKNNKGNFNFYLSDDGHKIKLNVDKELGQSKKIVREANKTLPKYVQRKQGFTEDTIKILRKIDDFAKDNNIEIVYFTPTYTDLYIKKMNIKLMLEQRSHFLNFIDGFYDLSYIQGVSNVYEFFHDPAHLNTLGLKKIFEEEFKKDNFINKNNFQRKTKKLRILLD